MKNFNRLALIAVIVATAVVAPTTAYAAPQVDSRIVETPFARTNERTEGVKPAPFPRTNERTYTVNPFARTNTHPLRLI